MSRRDEAAREAEFHERRRARCPRAAAMLDRLISLLTDKGANHRLEMAIVGLGASLDAGREIGDREAEFYESLLTEAA